MPHVRPAIGRVCAWLLPVLLTAACPAPGGEGEPDAGGDTTVPDAGPDTPDAGANLDAGDASDAGDRVDAGGPIDAGGDVDAGQSTDAGDVTDAGPIGDAGPRPITVVTFNTGTGTTNGVDDDGDAWTSTEQAIGDEHYGNGLAWLDAIDGVNTFFGALQPDLVAFQEIFHPGECTNIASEFYPGFVCEEWSAGDPTVAQSVMGAGYQVACNLEKPDKCAAVRTGFGSFRGCAGDLCLDGLDGVEIPGCGNGSRIGRGVVDLVGGGELTVVTVHGTSGATGDDADCRVAQVEQVFQDFDGEPAANGARNIVLGDLNTDPGRATLLDSSARRWRDFVDEGEAFHFVSDVGFGVDATYAGTLNIDHVISDVFEGDCYAPGVTAGVPPVIPTVHFDHTALVCEISEP